MKHCPKCEKMKLGIEFYKNASRPGGLDWACKPCVREYQKERHRKNPERAKAKWKRNYQRARERGEPWAFKHPKPRSPEKIMAKQLLHQAMKNEIIMKPGTCSMCNSETEKRLLHGYHANYSKPLDVEWLCPSCHGIVHSQAWVEDGRGKAWLY